MVQTTSKTATAKKTAAPPKSMVKKSTANKPVVAKAASAKASAPAKAVPAKLANTKEASKAPSKKPGTRTASASIKGNGEVVAKSKSKKASSVGAVTPEQRYRMICDAAFYRAERRGFIGGNVEQDWIDAEMEIDQQLCEMQGQTNH